LDNDSLLFTLDINKPKELDLINDKRLIFLQKNQINFQESDIGYRNIDLAYIDASHNFELNKVTYKKIINSMSNKSYIILHDTTVDAEKGETIRLRLDSKKQSIVSGYPIEEIECPLYGRLIGVEETSVLVAYIQKYKDKIIDAEMKLQIKTSRLTPCVVASCDIAPCDASVFGACLDKYRTLLEAPNSTKKPSLNDFLQEIFTVIPRSEDFVGLFATVKHILIGNFLKKILNENVKHIKENGNRFIGAGGVMCNGYLTLIIETFCEENGIEYVPTPKELCADNSIMVCMHACHKLAELNEIDDDVKLERRAFELGLQVPRDEATGDNVLIKNDKVTIGRYNQ
jgi:hypothetical protein